MQSEWRDIATAPKDGTYVWLWWPYWFTMGTRGMWNHGRWHSEDVISDLVVQESGPTHWMPLPAPPRPKGKHQ